MALDTVSDYVAAARIYLQDKTPPYRYLDEELVLALSMAIMESRKLRPDLWINLTLPSYTLNDTTAVPVDPMYRQAMLYYILGQAQLRDDEEASDSRAAAFIGMFNAKLTSVA
jgi:hypothetical protein